MSTAVILVDCPFHRFTYLHHDSASVPGGDCNATDLRMKQQVNTDATVQNSTEPGLGDEVVPESPPNVLMKAGICPFFLLCLTPGV